ncbi:MAG: type II toxin-antitoxin system Phd/YefM family antitoxin [Gemmatimonadota bacterium]
MIMTEGSGMFRLDDIHSLTEFQRNTREHLERLKETGRPEVLTLHGEAEMVVQDADAYQQLLDRLERAEAIAGIREGLASMERGEGRPLEEVVETMKGAAGID